ncbi:hypothetical protein [Erwinia rhapontici]|uniref:hypothetical protein n=1 Tax=Erwinia rhapontici TaxID=55212 RepID=UPI00143844FA|nr:hypothetical protein [Erwinia rhapontici]
MSRSQRGAKTSADAGSLPAQHFKTLRASIQPVKASAQPPQHTSVCEDGAHCPTPDHCLRSTLKRCEQAFSR